MGLTVRPTRSDDAEALAQSWLAGAQELIDMAPWRFRLPDADGLVEFIRKDLEDESRPDALSLVADLDGEIVGSLEARLLPPFESARFQVTQTWAYPACTSITCGSPHRFDGAESARSL
jgi:hypothetical protein